MAHVLIVEARFYDHINDLMLDGVRSALDAAKAGVASVIGSCSFR